MDSQIYKFENLHRRAAPLWLAGISKYHLDTELKVVRHVIEAAKDK